MAQTIIDLWHGRIAPCEHCGAYDGESNRQGMLMERYREALCCQLSDEQKALFQKYMDSSSDFLLRSMELAFQEGFRLGSRLMMETVN